MQEYNDEQIKDFVQKRYENFTDNKKAIIDFIAEHKICTIVLDHLIYETSTGISLITDPDEIKTLTNNHFQLCPSTVNLDKQIPA